MSQIWIADSVPLKESGANKIFFIEPLLRMGVFRFQITIRTGLLLENLLVVLKEKGCCCTEQPRSRKEIFLLVSFKNINKIVARILRVVSIDAD